MKLFFDVFLAGVAILSLSYATARADDEQIWLENPFYITCTEYAQQDADTQHTLDVLFITAVSRGSASSEDRYNLDHGTLSCTRGLQLLLQVSALDLRGNALRSLLPLAGLRNLNTLMLDDNDISDVAPLAHLSQLMFLSLSRNALTDIAPLRHLENLQFLVAADNDIVSVRALAASTSLLRLDITGNPVTDFIALQRARGPSLRIVGP